MAFSLLLIALSTLRSTTGSDSRARMDGFLRRGRRLLRYIFSMMRGTVTMRRGFVSAKASRIILGVGRRVRNCTWHPLLISNRNSNDIPYMCAVGSMATTLSPALSSLSASQANAMLEYRLR